MIENLLGWIFHGSCCKIEEEVHVQYEQQPEFPIPKLAHHHGTELIKVHGARAIFIDLFNDAVQVLRGQPVNENDKLVSVLLKLSKLKRFQSG